MKKRLFWKLFSVIACSTVLLFALIDQIASHTEDRMSYIDHQYRNEIRAYAAQAEHILKTEGDDALAKWVKALQEKEDTWVAIARPSIETLGGTQLSDYYQSIFTLGRSVDWKIHLYFKRNPTMDVPFSDGKTRFLITLPQRMRPGNNLLIIDLLLQVALPFAILCFITFVLYRQMMRPLRKLEQATQRFSEGDFSVRAGVDSRNSQDELNQLAATFDTMARRISTLIVDQRQLLADLSHELRTPLTRLNMAVDCVEQEANQAKALARLRYESSNMQSLIDDALTLAWFNTESPTLTLEPTDISELLTVIIEDAKFEYPEHRLNLSQSEDELVIMSSHQALAAALENIIRNALTHTPKGQNVHVSLTHDHTQIVILVEDNGPGVPEQHLDDMFKPFFRIPPHATREEHKSISSQKSGYGLGLALAKRQILALGGTLCARNRHNTQHQQSGLSVKITIPQTVRQPSLC